MGFGRGGGGPPMSPMLYKIFNSMTPHGAAGIVAVAFFVLGNFTPGISYDTSTTHLTRTTTTYVATPKEMQ